MCTASKACGKASSGWLDKDEERRLKVLPPHKKVIRHHLSSLCFLDKIIMIAWYDKWIGHM